MEQGGAVRIEEKYKFLSRRETEKILAGYEDIFKKKE